MSAQIRPESEDGNLRRLYARASVNPGVAGSAYIELGSTKVIASVYAPSERGIGADFSADATFECQAQHAPFALRPRPAPHELSGLDRALSISVEQALRPAVLLERFPKSAILVIVVVLEAGGGEHSAAVAAAALALADAGIDAIDIPAAAVVGFHVPPPPLAPRLILDPSATELAACAGSTVVSMLPRIGRLTHVAHTGRVPPATFTAAMQRGMEGCVAVVAALRVAAIDAARRRARAAAKAAAAGPAAVASAAIVDAGTTTVA